MANAPVNPVANRPVSPDAPASPRPRANRPRASRPVNRASSASPRPRANRPRANRPVNRANRPVNRASPRASPRPVDVNLASTAVRFPSATVASPNPAVRDLANRPRPLKKTSNSAPYYQRKV